MTTIARCYLREAVTAYGADRIQALYEGMKHYTDELMEIVNEAHPTDLPMVLAAMDTVEDTIRELPEYRQMNHAETSEKWCRKLSPVVSHKKVEIRIGEDMGEEGGT